MRIAEATGAHPQKVQNKSTEKPPSDAKNPSKKNGGCWSDWALSLVTIGWGDEAIATKTNARLISRVCQGGEDDLFSLAVDSG